MCLLQLWQFWSPSAWADALGLYTRGKRRFAACYPFVAVMFAYTGPRALQQGIRDWHPNEHYWTAARLDLWVLALYLVLALPVTIFWAIRWHAVNGGVCHWGPQKDGPAAGTNPGSGQRLGRLSPKLPCTVTENELPQNATFA